MRQLPQGNHRSAGYRDEHMHGDGLQVVPQFTWVTDDDGETFAPFHHCRHRLAADGGGNDVLYVAD